MYLHAEVDALLAMLPGGGIPERELVPAALISRRLPMFVVLLGRAGGLIFCDKLIRDAPGQTRAGSSGNTIFSSSMMASRVNLVHHNQGKRSVGILVLERNQFTKELKWAESGMTGYTRQSERAVKISLCFWRDGGK